MRGGAMTYERIGDSPVLAIIETYGKVQEAVDPAKLKKMTQEFGKKLMAAETALKRTK